MSCPLVVAAFDLDGTITVRDCVVPFLCRLAGWHRMAGAVVGQPARSLAAAGRRDRDAIKEIAVGGVFRGRRVADVAAAGETYAQHIATSWLRADVCARLDWHRARGDRTVVVTASLAPYVRPLARRLGIENVLCTDVVTHGDVYGDRLAGGNCRGPEKARRLRRWIDEADLAAVEIWAYGDSRGDTEMLAMADRPHLVRRVTVPAAPVAAER